jgi:hypothetical protein
MPADKIGEVSLGFLLKISVSTIFLI